MSGSSFVVSACVLAAVLLAQPSADHRLRRVLRSVSVAGDSSWAAASPGALVTWWSRARDQRPAVDGAAVVAELATLLRAGLPPARAWAALVAAYPSTHDDDEPLRCALVAAAAEAASGGDVAAPLRAAGASAADSPTTQLLAALSAAWEVAASAGAPTAAVLDRLATTLREEADLRDARATAMAAPRASARVLVALPVVGLLLGQLVGAAPLTLLVGSGLGRACALVGGALSLLAWWWTRRLVVAAQRP